MPSALPRSHRLSSSAGAGMTPASGACAGAQGAAAPVLDSADILRGQKTVEISHNGATYRLQATRLSKLILTK